MTNSILRAMTAAGAALLVSAAGALTTTDAASADTTTDPVTVTWTDWDQGTDVTLSPAETSTVFSSGYSADTCGVAIDEALQQGLPFSDSARGSCEAQVIACVQDAVDSGRAIGAVRFYFSATPRCLVR